MGALEVVRREGARSLVVFRRAGFAWPLSMLKVPAFVLARHDGIDGRGLKRRRLAKVLAPKRMTFHMAKPVEETPADHGR